MRSVPLLCLLGSCLSAQGPQPPDDVVLHSTQSFTFKDRLEWASKSAVAPKRFAGYAISSLISTETNSPREYGPHWDGYGKRIGMRMATGATGRFLESAIGGLWGEDPRYVRAAGQPKGKRLWNVVKMSFLVRNANGALAPAYGRYIAVPANSYLSNAWRPDSMATISRATVRIPLAFVDRIIANAISEVWPDLMKVVRRRR